MWTLENGLGFGPSTLIVATGLIRLNYWSVIVWFALQQWPKSTKSTGKGQYCTKAIKYSKTLGERYKLPQRVRAEPGRQTLSGAFSAYLGTFWQAFSSNLSLVKLQLHTTPQFCQIFPFRNVMLRAELLWYNRAVLAFSTTTLEPNEPPGCAAGLTPNHVKSFMDDPKPGAASVATSSAFRDWLCDMWIETVYTGLWLIHTAHRASEG